MEEVTVLSMLMYGLFGCKICLDVYDGWWFVVGDAGPPLAGEMLFFSSEKVMMCSTE